MVLFFASPLQAEQLSISGEQDIEELMRIAGESYDLNFEDAVYLFNGRKELWMHDGRLKTMIHQIIWINGDNAQDHFGDNRIAYDKKHRKLEVAALRSWRLGRDVPGDTWWESGPTAIVETLPAAMAHAFDYSNIRETMLLVDGIELPCVVEIAYTIEDKTPYRKGAEGMYLFASREPTVESLFTLGMPLGKRAVYKSSNENIPMEKSNDEKNGLDLYTWKIQPVPAMQRPHTVDAAAYTDHLTWSTWNSWRKFGDNLEKNFESSLVMDETLKDSLNQILEGSNTLMDKVVRITDFVNAKTNLVDYDETHWWGTQRNADRIFSTAYAHGLDRAILAAAMLKEAGLMVWPCFFSAGYGNIDEGVPTISRLSNVKVWISGENLEAFYDPYSKSVSMGFAPIYGKTVWLPGTEDNPTVRYTGEGEISKMNLKFDLKYDKELDRFTGNGFYSTNGGFCSYHKMRGKGNTAKSLLNTITSSVLPGGKVHEYNPVVFDPISTTINFDLCAEAGSEDAYNRKVLKMGQPSDGVIANLPHDIHLYEEKRTSPIDLWGKMESNVELKLDSKCLEIVHLPEESKIENAAGFFEIKVKEEAGKICIRKTLQISKKHFEASEWKDLRSLILTYQNDKNSNLYFK